MKKKNSPRNVKEGETEWKFCLRRLYQGLGPLQINLLFEYNFNNFDRMILEMKIKEDKTLSRCEAV